MLIRSLNPCQLCDSFFVNLVGLKSHIVNFHGIDFEFYATSFPGATVESSKCSITRVCSKGKSDDPSLLDDSAGKTKISEVEESQKNNKECDLWTSSEVEIVNATSNQKAEEIDNSEGRNCVSFNSEEAKEELESHKYQSKHEGLHSGSVDIARKPFRCAKCYKSYWTLQSLRRHIVSHEGKKDFECKICAKRFPIKNYLTRHKKIHLAVKPFACAFCCKAFTYKHDLDRHKKTHTGEKPFACNDCNKTFSLRHTLKRHEKTHTSKEK